MLFLARTGCQWRYLPDRYGPWGAVWQQWRRWRANGVWDRAMALLAREIRLKHNREATPSMLMIDAQTVRGGRAGPTFHEAGGRGGRTIGTKRTVVAEILGLPIAVRAESARPHDVRSGRLLLRDLLKDRKQTLPRLQAIVADRGYGGLDNLVRQRNGLTLDIKRPPPGTGGLPAHRAALAHRARVRAARPLAAPRPLLRGQRRKRSGLARGRLGRLHVRASLIRIVGCRARLKRPLSSMLGVEMGPRASLMRLAAAMLLGAGLTACAAQPSPSLSPGSQPAQPSVSASSAAPAATASDAWTALFRQYNLPSMAPDGSCPTTSGSRVDPAVGPGLGTGPIYPVGLGTNGTAEISEAGRVGDWYPIKVLWLSTPDYAGIGLVRGGRIDQPGELRFSGGEQDQVSALRLTLQGWAYGGTAPGSREWNSYAWVTGPGCYAFRLDGDSFGEIIVLEVP